MPEALRRTANHPFAGEGPMFRAMKADTDGLPRVGRSGREPGVRIEGPIRDVPVREDGTVEPGTGGMPAALDAARNLPKPRLPRSLGGEGRDPVFTMLRVEVPATLAHYRRLERRLWMARWIHGGEESVEEDAAIEEMEDAWLRLTDDEQDLLRREPPRCWPTEPSSQVSR